MRIFFLLFLGSSLLFGACGKKIDCTDFIVLTKEQNIQILKQFYQSLNQSMDKMFDLEEEYKKKLEEQNKLLNKLESLEKASLEYEKELNFLIHQNSLILDKVIDIDLTEKILEMEK